MEPRLTQHQTQRQILSPQIRQYLKLLQMPLIELSQAIDTELAENPMLEEPIEPTLKDDVLPEAEASPPPEDKRNEELEFGETFQHFEKMDENFRDGYNYADYSQSATKDMQKRRNFRETLITRPETLSDFLLWQLRFMDLSESEKKVAEEIIGNIDEEGYFRAAVEEITQSSGSTTEQVEKILVRIQDLDPPGIGARNLKEALLIQSQKKGASMVLATKIIAHYLPLLEKRDYKQLAKVLGVDLGEVRAAVSAIGHLEPKPGRTFYSEEPIAVTPDATVSFADSDEKKLKIEIHDEAIPELRLNAYYRRLLRKKATDEKTKAFLREKMQRAVNFLKALQLRKSTLREITEQILKAQAQFFEKGFSHLLPLRLKDIAQNIGIHESTVSRAIQGKYISTPQGTIPFKSFFSTKLETTSGEEESQKSIMEKMRKLIDNENSSKPLSDQDIVAILQKDGLVIARRTVAKYRDLLRILPSHLRRQR